ncbi:TIGR04282 family arsenosugar biosynthesis glycosyltransferase [Pontibacter sp. FD36]|uniref:TIGR04282 family arsenosugar biosynthesis glycosyltransferase n=1 Tax=Pontibacter sp. FD36 TaxID=2789860 RepID=UPI0018AA0645|nr:TIGR04282 family arsenosugar biosynthesis glycosyltransferase [Pontibacter sp. FD36]MBF8965493.1 TIGR04282 family arsenosugar biosynthesis glycosyltransferase [Pontibacter sp. FD36]
MKQADTVILVFLKPFEAGYVKTRLAATVGDAVALDVYRHLVEHTLQQLRKLQPYADVVLCYSRQAANGQYISEFPCLIQKGEDLGDRMLYALEWAHARKYDKKLIIGSDCFELTAEILEQAILWLETEQVVVGPAMDGGYYLIGMKESHAELFAGIPWSTSGVITATVEVLERLKLDWAALPPLSDLDEEQDLLSYPSLCRAVGLEQ